MTDVSVIIPTYNRLWALPMAIESCRHTNCKTEIIVVDDGSDDGTWEWLQLQRDVVAVKQTNQGKCWAANKGFELAQGKYVRFLDSDDQLAPNAIDEQFELAEKINADIVTSGYQIIDENNNVLSVNKWINCDDFIAQQLGECDGSHYSAFLFKKSFIIDIQHRPDFALRDDRMFILEAALKNPVLTTHGGCALLHRTHKNNRLQFTSGLKTSAQNYQHYQLYRTIIKRLEDEKRLTQRYKNAPCNILWHLAHWVAKHHLQDAKEIYDWVYQLNPNFTPTGNPGVTTLYKMFGFTATERLLRARRALINR